MSKYIAPGLIFVLFIVGGLLGIQAHTDPTEMDTVAYLSAAQSIQDAGGILKHIPNCLNGVYREATQHPLYLLFLAPPAENSLSYFVQAKFITFGISIALFLTLLLITKKCFGPNIACMAGFLMAINATVIRLGTMVACETLLALCFILFIYCVSKGSEIKIYWIWAGLFAGLTFLAKSLGILTLPIFVCSAIWYERKHSSKLFLSKYFWSFFGIFLLVAAPLFIRNIQIYGSPLYSDSSAVLWIDDWHEYSIERAQTGQIGLQAYLRSHTPKDMLMTLWNGYSDRDIRMLIDGLKPLAFWKNIDLNSLQGFHQKTFAYQGIWAAILMLFFLIGLATQRKNKFLVPSIFSLLAFFTFVGWFSKIFNATPPTRLLYCPLLLIIIFVAAGFVYSLNRVRKYLALNSAGRLNFMFCTIVLMVIAGCFMNHNWSKIDWHKTYKINPIFGTQLAWVMQNVKVGEKVWVGQSFASHQFYFKDQIKATIVDWPKLTHLDEYQKQSQKNSIKYAFIDIATVVHNYAVFGTYYLFNPQMGLKAKAALPVFMRPMSLNPQLERFYQVVRFDHATT
ncbi:MAG: hypothetical protein ACI9CF_001857 [Candidatus Omnitrophota bacterium]